MFIFYFKRFLILFLFLFLFFSFFFLRFNYKFINENFYLMGTKGKIQVFVKNIEDFDFIINKIYLRLKEIENYLTKFSDFSDINFLNNSYYNYYKTSKDTYIILKISNKILINTNGFFDIGLGNYLSVFGLDFNKLRFENFYNFNNIYSLLEFNKDKIRICRSNSNLDLGAIGKGYALEEISKIFSYFKINNFILEFGGEILVKSENIYFDPWIIFLDYNLNNNYDLYFLKIFNKSISVSGDYLKKSFLKKNYNHIINSKNFNKKKNFKFLFVSGENSILCDALSTACFSMDFLSLCKTKSLFYYNNIKVKL